jgi:hypothetical protein
VLALKVPNGLGQLTVPDFLALQNRDPDDRPINLTTGTKRSIMSNRISHYFNIKGPRYVASKSLTSTQDNF